MKLSHRYYGAERPKSSENTNHTDPEANSGELNNGTDQETTAPSMGEERYVHGIK